jgi:excisionase family DNA binding protein
MQSHLLKAREVADYLDIGLSTVWHWTASGRLPRPIRIGRVTRWSRGDIEAFLDAWRRARFPEAQSRPARTEVSLAAGVQPTGCSD